MTPLFHLHFRRGASRLIKENRQSGGATRIVTCSRRIPARQGRRINARSGCASALCLLRCRCGAPSAERKPRQHVSPPRVGTRGYSLAAPPGALRGCGDVKHRVGESLLHAGGYAALRREVVLPVLWERPVSSKSYKTIALNRTGLSECIQAI